MRTQAPRLIRPLNDPRGVNARTGYLVPQDTEQVAATESSGSACRRVARSCNSPGYPATGRQEREGRGYGLGDFAIDFDAHTATCPQGKTSTGWIDTKIDGHPRIHVDFYNAGCPVCPAKPDCTSARYRGLTLHPREQHEALQRRRREQDTDAWRQRYATRAGIEGTIAQTVNACDARRVRYKGLPKVRIEYILLATAINLIRLDAWWTGTPLGPTRTSHYARLELGLAA